eukprot:363451-Chlamydomonas_euryale.AAC.13
MRMSNAHSQPGTGPASPPVTGPSHRPPRHAPAERAHAMLCAHAEHTIRTAGYARSARLRTCTRPVPAQSLSPSQRPYGWPRARTRTHACIRMRRNSPLSGIARARLDDTQSIYSSHEGLVGGHHQQTHSSKVKKDPSSHNAPRCPQEAAGPTRMKCLPERHPDGQTF